METKQNGRGGFVTTIVLLALLVLGLAGFICYDKFFKDDGGNSSYENKGNVVLSEKEMEQKSKELMELYMRPVIYDFEGDYTDDIKTQLIIKLSSDIATKADCKSLYENDNDLCDSESVYFDAKILREKSLELFGKDVLVKHKVSRGWGQSFDYVEKEDGYVKLNLAGGAGPNAHYYAITSSSIENNQYKIDFLAKTADLEKDELDQEKLYTIIFDIKSDGKYVFNDLKEKQFERIYECYEECGYMSY